MTSTSVFGISSVSLRSRLPLPAAIITGLTGQRYLTSLLRLGFFTRRSEGQKIFGIRAGRSRAGRSRLLVVGAQLGQDVDVFESRGVTLGSAAVGYVFQQ